MLWYNGIIMQITEDMIERERNLAISRYFWFLNTSGAEKKRWKRLYNKSNLKLIELCQQFAKQQHAV